MIYLRKMAIQRIVTILKDLWSVIQRLVQCIMTAVRTLNFSKLNYAIFISIYQLFYLY